MLAAPLYTSAVSVKTRPTSQEAGMRAEAQKHVDSIQEALALLRRHL